MDSFVPIAKESSSSSYDSDAVDSDAASEDLDKMKIDRQKLAAIVFIGIQLSPNQIKVLFI